MLSFVFFVRRQRLSRLLVPALLLGLVVVFLSWQVLAVSAQGRQVPIYRVETPQQAVAISFDASWGAEYTPLILDILDEYNVKTTFFLVNIWLEEYPDLAREIVARGHELGLHSVSHPDFTTLSRSQMDRELAGNFALIKELTGYEPTLFRCPFGAYNNQVLQASREGGYTCVQWSKDSLDWKDLSAAEILPRVTKNIQAGEIILFHNNGLHTAEALPQVLEYYKQQGLAVVPVGRLLLQGDWYVDANGVQRSQTIQPNNPQAIQ